MKNGFFKNESVELEAPTNSKKRHSKNRKIGTDKINNYTYVPNTSGKLYQNCGGSNHVTHACKKPISTGPSFICKYKVSFKDKYYPFFDKLDCMPCNMNFMTRCFNFRRRFIGGCIS